MTSYLYIVIGPYQSEKKLSLIRQINLSSSSTTTSCIICREEDFIKLNIFLEKYSKKHIEIIQITDDIDSHIDEICLSYNNIGVLNGHKFNNIKNFVFNLLINHKKVFISSINSDETLSLNKEISNIIPLCNKIDYNKGICYIMNCSNDATINDYSITNVSPICLNCYIKKIDKSKIAFQSASFSYL